ncbi:hypothetical protein SAY86_006209 [Trapa natans]|uniref:Cation/H+ exchanger transmembrane domain-containing protein n=1 Tax=Trapa natans TaxID=22666 RepID=A0AAN7QVR1_TRANT|nr:hypothetical protein SAY86_006209 [Trapa natans]
MAFDELVQNLGGEHKQVVPVTVFIAFLCLCLVISHLLEENRWINESITAILFGCLSGTLILLGSRGKSSHILRFNEELFFIYLLPPIIFNAGFQVKKKQFFQNFFTIMLFGVVGVFISVFVVTAGSRWLFPKLRFDGLTARDYLAIGTIFSSTDTVCTLQVLHQDETPRLYSLVFGEGVVNDATSVVLFNAVQKLDVSRLDRQTAFHIIGDFCYLFSTSTVLGIVTGLLTSYSLKALYFGRHSSVREIALMVLMAYLSYMMAELLELSGILTVFFCGIIMSHYAWHNVTESSRVTTKHVFAMMSLVAETFIFLYVGMDALDIEKWKVSKLRYGHNVLSEPIRSHVIQTKILYITTQGLLYNMVSHNNSLVQVIIWWAGLMRGAVSIALAFKQFTHSGVTKCEINATMITNTNIVVLLTTLVFGFLTKPLIRYLLPHGGSTNQIYRESTITKDDQMNLPLLSMVESATTNLRRAKDGISMLIERPVHTIHSYWRKFDDTYMRPIFGGPPNSL